MLSGGTRDPVVMKCRYKTSLKRRTADILRNEDGASIVLVTIISIIIVASVVILSVNVSSLKASADKQFYHDQAYEAARTMGLAIDGLISENKVDLKSASTGSESKIYGNELFSDNSNNIEVHVYVKTGAEAETYCVNVAANAGTEDYVFTATYIGSGTSYARLS